MGSDVAAHAAPLDPATARARRSLAAARAARDGITTMVDALRISKPPRGPPKAGPGVPSSVPAARRHALIPLAEGRVELEARIRALEDVVAARDADLVRLKRQWGRALVKRKNLEKERDAAWSESSALRDAAKAHHAFAVSARKRLARFADDVAVPLPGLRDALDAHREALADVPGFVEDVTAGVDDIEEVVSAARDSLTAHPPMQLALEDTERRASALSSLAANAGGTPVINGRSRLGTGRSRSTAGSDDDAKSCASFASSTGFGDDHEMQLDALVEIVDVLEAKISSGSSYPLANSAIVRAKKTIASSRIRGASEVAKLVAERDRLEGQLNAVMEERESLGGEDAAMALAAKAQADLRDAEKEVTSMRERLCSVEKIAERAVRQDSLMAKNAALEGELRSAKKTVERLLQERTLLRRTAPPNASAALSNGSHSSKVPAKGNSEAMRRILDWRQRASSENLDRKDPVSMAFAQAQHKELGDLLDGNAALRAREGSLPDRETERISVSSPAKKRRLVPMDGDSANANDTQSPSERSLDPGGNDSASTQSIHVQGFLRRHDSFLSAGNVSASGDEITITNNRNIFGAGGPKVDGLRGLLGGP